MRRNIIKTLILAGLAVGMTLPLSAHQEISEVFNRVKGSVVVLETEQNEIDPTLKAGLVRVGAVGSGVLISDDGKIFTAAHVVQTAESITVRFPDGEMIPARVLYSAPRADLALVQLTRLPRDAQVAPVGDSDSVNVGDQVFVVGAPQGISNTLTVGHISARRSENVLFGSLEEVELFQTDASINHGNSGGPMFNMQGEVIGIVSFIISESGGSEGLGFVISSKSANHLLMEQSRVWSGMKAIPVDGLLAAILNVPQAKGMLVEAVAKNSLGSHLGIEGGLIKATIADVELVLGGDVILEVQGISLNDPDARNKIRDSIGALKDGDKITVRVLRGGEIIELNNYFFPDLLLPGAAKPARKEKD
jgi:serine protease Do